MLELKQVTISKEKINGCTVESTNVKTVNVKTKGQERTFQKRYLQSVYHLDSMYINVIHDNGRKGRIDVYALAFYCVFKTLRKAATKRAIELFDNKFSYCVHDWQDMIMTGVDYMLFGYVDGNGKYHKGYYTDKIGNIKELTGVIFSAVNHVIYAKGVTGKWTGKEVLTDDFAMVKKFTDVYGVIKSNAINVNAAKYQQFIDDIRKNVKTAYLSVFDCIVENDYINVDGTTPSKLIADVLGISDRKVRRAMNAVEDAATQVVSGYNMTVRQFIDYLQTA